MNAKKSSKFETALKELEGIVTAMEQGGLELEESLRLFTKGVNLVKECQQTLKTAEQKVKILSGDELTEFVTHDNNGTTTE